LRSRTGSAAAKGCDYIVVGAGAAGCVVAGRLSQTMPDAHIALIEAGGERLGLTTRVPGTAFIATQYTLGRGLPIYEDGPAVTPNFSNSSAAPG